MPRKTFEGVDYRRQFRTIELGCSLQRLFSTFPDGWPGFGLLLLRLGVGIALAYNGVASLVAEVPAPLAIAQDAIAAAAGIFLIAGLWTPIVGALAALVQVWIALSHPPSQPPGAWIHIFLAVLSASLAMLGPGVWSIDARLFGRKLVYRYRNRCKQDPPKG